MSAPYRTLPAESEAGFVPIPNPNGNLKKPVSLSTQIAVPPAAAAASPPSSVAPPTTHIHFQRLENQTPRPAAIQQPSPSSHVNEVSTAYAMVNAPTTAKLEAETSQSYINERGERLHGNYRDPVQPNSKINGKTPLPPIPWVDERATAAPTVSSGIDEDHDDEDDDDQEDDEKRNSKLTTKESSKSLVPDKSDSDHHDDDDVHMDDDDDEEFGPDSDRPGNKPNKNKNEESESHILISDFKLTTDRSPDHKHDEDEPVTGAPEATLKRPKAEDNQDHDGHDHDGHEDDHDEAEEHQSQENEDDHDDELENDEDLKDPEPTDKKKIPAESNTEEKKFNRPAGFTPAEPGSLKLDDDDHDAQQEGYSPPDGFFSEDFGKEFADNEDNPFENLDFDYDKFMKVVNAEKGIDDKVSGLAHGADKAESMDSIRQNGGGRKEKDKDFFKDEDEDRRPLAPAKYPRLGYTGIPFSWDSEDRKKSPGAKGKESGMYYDKYHAHRSPFGSEMHRDMRYQKEGSRAEKTKLKPKGIHNNPFSDPNFDFDQYIQSIAATTSTTTTTHAPASYSPVRPASSSTQKNNPSYAENEEEEEEDDEDENNAEPTRRTAHLRNTVKAPLRQKHKSSSSEEVPIAKNHRYETGKVVRPHTEASAGLKSKRRPPAPPPVDYEDMVSVEDKRSPPKYPRSTERSVRSTTPMSSVPHTTAYSMYPREGPRPGEFAFEQSNPDNLFFTPRPKTAASIARERVAGQATPSTLAVESSSFSVYGPDHMQYKFRKELDEMHDSFRKPLFTLGQHRPQPSIKPAASNVKKTGRKLATKQKPDDEMKEYFDELGYSDEFKVENVHLAPTESYDDLNPLKDIYPDIQAHLGLTPSRDVDDDDVDEPKSKSPPKHARARTKGPSQYQVFEDIAESRLSNRTTVAPRPTSTSTPNSLTSFTRPKNRSHPESFRPSNHKVTYHELTQTHPKTKPRVLGTVQQGQRTTTTRQSNRLTTPVTQKPKSASTKDNSRSETRDTVLTRTTPTTASRRPDGGKKTHGYRYSNLQLYFVVVVTWTLVTELHCL